MRPPDEVKRELVRQWLAKAEQDLGLAEHLLSEGMYLSAIGYHAQQAAEKFLKALLVEHQIEFPRTHDLGMLLDLVEGPDKGVAESLRDVIVLCDYAVDVRYPGDIPELDLEEARNAVQLALKVKDEILKALSEKA